MNAGAYGGEMKDVLYKCEHIDKNGDRGFLENDNLKLSYRHSAYYDNGAVITGLYLKLKKAKNRKLKKKWTTLSAEEGQNSRLNIRRQAQRLNVLRGILQAL